VDAPGERIGPCGVDVLHEGPTLCPLRAPIAFAIRRRTVEIRTAEELALGGREVERGPEGRGERLDVGSMAQRRVVRTQVVEGQVGADELARGPGVERGVGPEKGFEGLGRGVAGDEERKGTGDDGGVVVERGREHGDAKRRCESRQQGDDSWKTSDALRRKHHERMERAAVCSEPRLEIHVTCLPAAPSTGHDSHDRTVLSQPPLPVPLGPRRDRRLPARPARQPVRALLQRRRRRLRPPPLQRALQRRRRLPRPLPMGAPPRLRRMPRRRLRLLLLCVSRPPLAPNTSRQICPRVQVRRPSVPPSPSHPRAAWAVFSSWSGKSFHLPARAR
jgi:hypothetical protein